MSLIIPYNNTRIFNFKVTPKLSIPPNIIKPPHILNKNYTPSNRFAIYINNKDNLSKIRYVSKIAANSLTKAISLIQNKALRTGDEVDKYIHKYIIKHNCYPSSLGYQSFPKTLSISPNDIICHGIPNINCFKEGDFINLDLTVYYEGMHSDTSAMVVIGKVHPKIKRLINIAQKALYVGISQCKPGNALSCIGKSIENYVLKQKVHIVKEFCGHGIGEEIHMLPIIHHYFKKNDDNIIMKEGMIFSIEPIICLNPNYRLILLNDKWTIFSPNNPSAQFEHTILITKKGYEILTKRNNELIRI